MFQNPFRKAIARFAGNSTPARALWMSARSRNAMHRPVFIGTVSVTTFVAALVALIVVPQQARRKAEVIAPRPEERVDTTAAVQALNLATARLTAAESALAVSRRVGRELQGMAVDTVLSPTTRAVRDSLTNSLGLIATLVERVRNAPLSTSYRALAEAPELRGDPRVRAMVDTLAQVEREREAFGSAGGVDPIFITLTSRMNEIGRSIEAIAEERRSELRSKLAALMPTPLVPTSAQLAQADTGPPLAALDTARTMAAVAAAELARRRSEAREFDIRAERAQELTRFSTPPFAVLGAALVLGAVFGFGSALSEELRRPRLADVAEAERVSGLRALGVIEARRRSPERYRRKSDKNAPPYIDPSLDGYQLIHMHLGTEVHGPLVLTVTGDEAQVASVVASNLAAISADEARHTLLIDTDVTACGVAAALRIRPEPGVVELIDQRISWADATTSATVGRSSMVDVIPSGTSLPVPDVVEVSQLLQGEVPRLTRRYDTILVVASADHALNGVSAVLPVPDVLVCVRIGHTQVKALREGIEALRRAGGNPIGLAVWNAPLPLIPLQAEITGRRTNRTAEFAVPAGSGARS